MTQGDVVADSGPLIALALVDQLHLLHALYGEVLIPDAVYVEVVELGKGRAGAVEVQAATYLSRVVVDPPPEPLLTRALGPGEAEAIALAHCRSARLILLDDRRARRIAEHAYGLPVKGTAGILVAARREQQVSAIRPLLRAMQDAGYFLSPRLVERACREAGE